MTTRTTQPATRTPPVEVPPIPARYAALLDELDGALDEARFGLSFIDEADVVTALTRAAVTLATLTHAVHEHQQRHVFLTGER